MFLCGTRSCHDNKEGADGAAGWAMGDGCRLPARKSFEDAHWHEATRTFHAAVSWAPTTWWVAGADGVVHGSGENMHAQGCCS
jgi:hypothetical protein